MLEEDLYEILGISPDADDREVHSAYRTLAKKYHPDSGYGSSDEKFREVQRAYDVLHDAERRAAYDHGRQQKTAREATSRYRPAPAWNGFVAPRSSPDHCHIDLRYLGRRPPSERIQFPSRPAYHAINEDPWEELISFLLKEI